MTSRNCHWTLMPLFAALIMGCTAGTGHGDVVTFDNGPGTTGNDAPWEDPLNWDTNLLPGPADDAVVPTRDVGNRVLVGADVGEIKSLRIGGNGDDEQVRIGGLGSLIVTEDLFLGHVDAEGNDYGGTIRTQEIGAFLAIDGNIVASSDDGVNDIVINRGTLELRGDIIMEGENRIDTLDFRRGDFLLTGSNPQTLTVHRLRVAHLGSAADATFTLGTGKTLIATNPDDDNDIGSNSNNGNEDGTHRLTIGILEIPGGTATFAGALRVGLVDGTADNTIGDGQIHVSGAGTLTANNGLQLAMGNVEHATSEDPTTTGEITVGTGSTVTVAGGIRMAETDPRTKATITINDGLFQLNSGDITTGDDVGTGTSIINLNGGTLDLAGTDAVSRVVTEYSHTTGATLKLTVFPEFATLEANTMTLAASSGGSVIDLDTPAPAASNKEVTWDAGTDVWDLDATKWNPDVLPAAGSIISQNDQITILRAGSIANSGNAALDASDTAGWSLQTSSTEVKVTRTGPDINLGPAVAVIDSPASIVTRDADLNVQFATEAGVDASRLEIRDGSLTLSGSNNLILGDGPGQGDVNHSGGTATIGGVLQFGSAAGDTGGVYTLSSGTLDVQGNVGGKSIVVANPGVATATLIYDGGTLNTAGAVEVHQLIVGNEQDATLSLSDSTFTTKNGNQLIGNAPGVTASLNISGTAEVNFGDPAAETVGEVRIGGDDGDNTTNGTVTLSDDATVKVYGGNTEVGVRGNGTLDIQGGTWSQLTNNLVIGQGSPTGAVGTFLLKGGVYDLRPSTAAAGPEDDWGDWNFNDSDNNSDIGARIPSTATLTGGTMWVGNDIQLMQHDDESSVLTIDGAVLNVADDIDYRNEDDNSTDTINLKSGSLAFSPEVEPEDGINSIIAGAIGTEVNEFNWTGGTLSGLEEFLGLDLVQQATDAPSRLQIGSSAGTMTIAQEYLLDAGDNTLEIELFAKGTGAGTDFDLLTVVGTATLSGTVEVLDQSGGAISGDDFEWNVVEADEIMLAGAVNVPTGFDFRVVEDFDGGLTDVLQIFLTGVSSTPGDYNNNGTVEQGDLDLVLLNWGEPWPPAIDGWVNDQPTDGTIDQNDLDGVLLNWGNSSQSVSAVVPEPTTGLMLIVGIAAMLVRRKVVLT